MKRISLIAVIATLVASPAAVALDRAQETSLLRTAVTLSRLSARGHVPVVAEQPARFRQRRLALLDRSYPRAAQAYDEAVYRALGLATSGKGGLRQALIQLEDASGLYDPGTRTAYVQAGAGERAAALRGIVLGLQDQHFDLGRIGSLRGGDDARIAATAAVQGFATLSTRVPPSRRRSSQSGSRLMRFLQLERGFVDSVGLRFEADLRNLGGTRAAIDSLRRFPATSEQVFHLDKYLEREPAAAVVLPVRAAGMRLARSGSFGELDVRALLAVFDVSRLDRAGSGWGGGRTGRYTGAAGDAVAVALDWDTSLDAAQWTEAVSHYVDAAFDAAAPGLPVPSACGVTTCWQLGSRAIAFDRSGRHSALVLGADLHAVEGLARALASGASPVHGH